MGDYSNQLSALYREYRSLIIAAALRIHWDYTYAQEVLQDTMLKVSSDCVMHRIENMNSKTYIKNYVLKIARSKAIDRYNKMMEDNQIISLEQQCVGVGGKRYIDSSFEEELISKEKVRMIIACVNNLPEIYRQVIRYKVFEQMDTEGIANLYGISKDTVRKRLQRARQLLRCSLEQAALLDSRSIQRRGY